MTFNKPPGRLVLFTSHSWAHGHHRADLHELLAPDWIKEVDYTDLSIPRAHPVEVEDDLGLAQIIRARLLVADAFLITAGMYAAQSEWIKFEVHAAFGVGVPIIPVAPWRQQRLPRVATSFGCCDPISWTGNSIRAAILGNISPARRAEFLEARAERTRASIRSRLVPSAFDGAYRIAPFGVRTPLPRTLAPKKSLW